ncbi:N-acetylmuramoyl-L-alanine amidase [Intestinibacter bartlettii]|uniref:N-acetylmuramoyl-L-alanine amidase n=1 Tax=Intestinibacter bartlettii TaxID=261299 RepID=UPI003AB66DCE
MSKYLVAIDAGHGMHTEGKQSVPMSKNLYIDNKLVREKGKIIKENEWNRGVSEYLSAALKRCGIDTMFTADMTGKTDIPLSTRANTANKKGADILISNHYNAIGNCDTWQSRVKGLLVLRTKNASSKSIKLGKLAAKHLEKDIDYEYSYGLMRDVDMSGFTLAILRQTTMPAILIEYGFMDYEKEAKLMLDKKHQEKCAEAVAKAVCEYFGVTYIEKQEETTEEANKTKYVRILQDINIHSKSDFDAANVIGKVTAGGAYTVVETIKRSGTDMYKLKSGVYITASPKYVEVFEK